MQIRFITTNKNKNVELQHYFSGNHKIKFIHSSLEISEYQEKTVAQVSWKKCEIAFDSINSHITNIPVLVEDTGLILNHYGNFPGPYIKWVSDYSNLVDIVSGVKNKIATDICVFSLKVKRNEDPIQFIGMVEGKIVEGRGDNGFGWDRYFEVNGKTYAEIDIDSKSKVSARSIALSKLKKYIDTL